MEQCRKDDQAGQNRDRRVECGDPAGRGHEVISLGYIRSVRNHGTHAQTETEESLADCGEHHAAGDLAEVGLEVEFESLGGSRKRNRAHREQHEEHQEYRHQHFGPAFDPVPHAAEHHVDRENHEGEVPGECPYRIARHLGEDRRRVRFGAESSDRGLEHVREGPARDDRVEAQDRQAGEYAQGSDEHP